VNHLTMLGWTLYTTKLQNRSFSPNLSLQKYSLVFVGIYPILIKCSRKFKSWHKPDVLSTLLKWENHIKVLKTMYNSLPMIY
jgi:hypothetical protein